MISTRVRRADSEPIKGRFGLQQALPASAGDAIETAAIWATHPRDCAEHAPRAHERGGHYAELCVNRGRSSASSIGDQCRDKPGIVALKARRAHEEEQEVARLPHRERHRRLEIILEVQQTEIFLPHCEVAHLRRAVPATHSMKRLQLGQRGSQKSQPLLGRRLPHDGCQAATVV